MRQSTLAALFGFILLWASSAWAQAPAKRAQPADVPPSLAPGASEGASPSDLLPPAPPATPAPPPASQPAPQVPAAPVAPHYAPAYAAGCGACRPYVPCPPPVYCHQRRCGHRGSCCAAPACYPPACYGPAYHAAPGRFPSAMTAPAIWRYR